MRFSTYMLITGLLGVPVALLGVWFILVGSASPGLFVFVGTGIVVIVLVPILFLVWYAILRAQLDRHEGSVPMPGWLGAWFDIVEDDVADGAGRAGVAARPAPPTDSDYALHLDDRGRGIEDGGGTEVLATCPECGLRELRAPGAPCRVCGHRFLADLTASSPA